MTELKPRTYLLRIEKERYHPWFKTVAVEKSLVNEYRNIVLVPYATSISHATSTKEEIIRIFLLPADSQAFSLDKKNNLIDKNGGVLAPNIHVFSKKDDTIYLIDKNGFLGRYHMATGIIDVLGRPGFYLAEKNFRFIFSPQNDLSIIDPSGGLFFLLSGETLEVITGGVKQARFDSESNKLLVIKENQLFVRWIRPNTAQPFQKEKEEDLIIELNTKILDAAWFYETSAHIAIRTAEGIFLTEIDGRGGRNTAEIQSGKTEELSTSPLAPNAIFYRKEKTWFRVEL